MSKMLYPMTRKKTNPNNNKTASLTIVKMISTFLKGKIKK